MAVTINAKGTSVSTFQIGKGGLTLTNNSGVLEVDASLQLTNTTDQLILPQSNDAVTPTLAFGDGDTGFYELQDDLLAVSLVGVVHFVWEGSNSSFRGSSTRAPQMIDRTATATLPVFTFQSNSTTGLGSNALDSVSLIAGSVELIRCNEVVGANQVIISPGVIVDDAVTPVLAFGDGDTGFYENSDDFLSVAIAGSREFVFGSGTTGFGGITGGAGRILNEAASATNPTLIPLNTDVDTGIGSSGDDAVSIIAGGLEMLRLVETGTSTTDQLIIGPAGVIGAEATPSLAFGDGDSGFFESVDDAIGVSLAGSRAWIFQAGSFTADAGNGPRMMNEGSTATNPTLIPALGDPSTGIGGVTGDISIIVGSSSRVRITSSLSTFTGNVQLSNSVGPTLLDEAATATNPTLVPNRSDPDTGIGWGASLDEIILVAGGVEAISAAETGGGITLTLGGPTTIEGNLLMEASAGPSLINTTATATTPTMLPDRGDTNTGIGQTDDALSLIAGGIEALRLTEASSSVLQASESNVGLTANSNSTQGDSPITSSYSVYSTVVTAGDAVTLPATFIAGTTIYIKNDGAESMDVFPASGDNAGAGDNTAIAVAAGESATFIGTTADTTWSQLLVSGGGSGDVTKVGTPVDNQVGVWTGDGTIEGDTGFIWNGTQLILAETPADLQTAPTLALGDGDTGFYEPVDDFISVTLGGTRHNTFATTAFSSNTSNGPQMVNEGATATNPTLIPHVGNSATGIGAESTSNLSLICDGVEAIRCVNTAGIDQVIISPGIVVNDPATPSLAFGDGNTGFYENADNFLSVAIAGVREYAFGAGIFQAITGGAAIRSETPSATNPTLCPTGTNSTGIGSADAGGVLSLIALGIEGLRLTHDNSGVIHSYGADLAITAFSGGGQGSAINLKHSYNVIGTSAAGGDSVRLTDVFAVGSVTYIKNDGANAVDIFPASGDDLGAGTNTAVSIAVGESKSFIATTANATWTQFIVDTSGSGDVTKVGTPVDNEIGVWTGDGTLEGDANLTWDGTNLALTGTTHIVLPQTNDTATPTLAFGDGDTGFYEISDDNIGTAIAGSLVWQFTSTSFGATAVGNGPSIQAEASTATNPTLVPLGGAPSTGIGGVAGTVSIISNSINCMDFDEASGNVTNTSKGKILAPNGTAGAPTYSFTSNATTGMYAVTTDTLLFSAGGTEAIRFTEVSNDIIQASSSNVGLTAEATTPAQGDAPITSSYNVYSTVANAGDAVTLPATFLVGTQIYIKNDGANSMDVFPASGDDAGAGDNTAVAVASGAFAVFMGTVADGTWTKIMGGTV